MPKWCVESYPSSLYKFEKTRFWHFVIISGRGQGGPNPCLPRRTVGKLRCRWRLGAKRHLRGNPHYAYMSRHLHQWSHPCMWRVIIGGQNFLRTLLLSYNRMNRPPMCY